MEKLTPETFVFLFERAGLKVTQKDMERLEPLLEKYMENLKELQSIDLGDEEVAATFRPELTNK